MKKFLVCVVAIAAMVVTASAQEKAVWGVRAGMNVTNLTGKSGGESESLDSKIGFNVGVSYQLPLVSKLYLETGLNLTSRGAKSKAGSEVDDFGAKFNMLYVQLPVAISWHFDIKSISLQPYVGAYYGLGISGKIKVDGADEKINLFKETTVADESVPQIFKRSDVGLRFGLGVAIHKRYYVGLGYDLGLTNIVKAGEDVVGDGKITNGSFYISLGYNF